MKSLKFIGSALVATMVSFSACTNDYEEIITQDSEIKLTSRIMTTRVTSLDYQSTQIVSGQKVGITITGANAEHENVAWTAGENGVLTNTETPVYWNNEDITIIAYHPHHSLWTETNHEFSVSTDQSTDIGYSNSDLLWASIASPYTEIPVSLHFVHKLAKINITITSDDIEDLSNTTISICGTNISTGFNPTTGVLTEIEGIKADIKASVTTAEAYTASAIIVPQTIEKETKFIKFTHGNKNFFYTLPEKMQYLSGHSYHYRIKIDDSNFENPVEGEETEW